MADLPGAGWWILVADLGGLEVACDSDTSAHAYIGNSATVLVNTHTCAGAIPGVLYSRIEP